MTDVWTLENEEQQFASYLVNDIYEKALGKKGSVHNRNLLKKLYGCGWEEIKNKMDTEGSVWYVWYMDGVNNFVANYLRGK